MSCFSVCAWLGAAVYGFLVFYIVWWVGCLLPCDAGGLALRCRFVVGCFCWCMWCCLVLVTVLDC